MVCVDYNAGGPDYLESLMFLFDTEVMDEATTARIELQEAELSEFRFVPVAEATTLLVERAGRRLATVLSGDGAGEVSSRPARCGRQLRASSSSMSLRGAVRRYEASRSSAISVQSVSPSRSIPTHPDGPR